MVTEEKAIGWVLWVSSQGGLLLFDCALEQAPGLRKSALAIQDFAQIVQRCAERTLVVRHIGPLVRGRLVDSKDESMEVLRLFQPTHIAEQHAEVSLSGDEGLAVSGDLGELGDNHFVKLQGPMIGPFCLRQPTIHFTQQQAEVAKTVGESPAVYGDLWELGRNRFMKLHGPAMGPAP